MSDPGELTEFLLAPETRDLEPTDLLASLGAFLGRGGFDLHRLSVWIPTKHPELWGHQLSFTPAEGARVFRRSHDASQTLDYVGTPAEALHESGRSTLRVRLEVPSERSRFAMLDAMAAAGATDYLLASTEPKDRRGAWISYATRRPGGFDEAHLRLLDSLTPLISLHLLLIAARFETRSLLDVYLGRNAAERVIAGQFRRATGTEIDAALWFCDMRGFTELSDRLPARSVVSVLDRYFEHVATPIAERGGEILKFIGDAVLAVFPVGASDAEDACGRAFEAALDVLASIERWQPGEVDGIELGIALHRGRVFYGNIGGRERLDFTVIGGSVNEACRVEAMCKVLGEPVLMTESFARALPACDLVSLGSHALKGVAEPAVLYTTRRRRAP